MFGWNFMIGSGSGGRSVGLVNFDIQPYVGTASVDGVSYASWTDLLASGKASFTRASVQWSRNVAGTYLQFTSGNAAITDRGLRLEPAATNLVPSSQDYSVASWTQTTLTPTTGQADVFGGTGGTQFLDGGSTSLLKSTSAISVVSAATYTVTFILKKGTLPTWHLVGVSNSTGSAFSRAWINLATGAVGTKGSTGSWGVPTVATPVQLANSYWLIQMTFTPSGSSAYVYTQTANADNTTVRYASGVGGDYTLCHVQLETGATGTSPIFTTGTSATRAACALTISARAGTYDVTYTLTDASTVAAAGTSVPFVASTALTQPVTRIQGTAL